MINKGMELSRVEVTIRKFDKRDRVVYEEKKIYLPKDKGRNQIGFKIK